MADPIWIDADQVRARLSPDAARRLLRDALLAGFDPADDPSRMTVPAGAGEMLVMPSAVGSAAGVKVLTVAPGNPARGLQRIQAWYVLLDDDTLAPSALLDGTALTSLRTPAVSMLGVDALCVADPDLVVFIGSGPQSIAHAEALLAIRRPRRGVVHARDASRAAVAADNIIGLGLPCAVADQAALAATVREADLVVVCTSAAEPVVVSEWVADGACVVAIGSHEPDRRELDAALMRRSLVVVEDVATALREAGDVVLAIDEGELDPQQLHTIAQVVRGEIGRHEDRPNVFKTVGMGWQDLVVAAGVFPGGR